MGLWEEILSHGDKAYSVTADWIHYGCDADEFVENVEQLWPVCQEHLDQELAQWIVGDIVNKVLFICDMSNDRIFDISPHGLRNFTIPFGRGVTVCRNLLESVLADDRWYLCTQYDALDSLIALEESVAHVKDNLICVLQQVAETKNCSGMG